MIKNYLEDEICEIQGMENYAWGGKQLTRIKFKSQTGDAEVLQTTGKMKENRV